MYTNIPVNEAIEVLFNKMKNKKFNFYCFDADDIISLVYVIFNSAYFTFNGSLFKQIKGLSMGNKLSGILADLFIDKIEKQLVETHNIFYYYRYVDDILLILKSKEEANALLDEFNKVHPELKFEIEHPINGKLGLLDFSVEIINGKACFKPFAKAARSDIFVSGDSAIPNTQKVAIVKNEWERIRKRCSSNSEIKKEKSRFIFKLQRNGHKNLPYLNVKNFIPREKVTNQSERIFYLSIPFLSDAVNANIRKLLRPLGLNIRLSHKSKFLKNVLNPNKGLKTNKESICKLKNCKMDDKSKCFISNVVYSLVCMECKAEYIGSTLRHLHTRVKEHFTLSSSSVFSHNVTCGKKWKISILCKCDNVGDLRIKEAILIKDKHPFLNKKEDLLKLSVII
jgi:hypothetical protein